MSKKGLLAIVLAAIIVLLLSVLPACKSAEETKPATVPVEQIKWRYPICFPLGTPEDTECWGYFADQVLEGSGGRIDLEIYAGGALVPLLEQGDACSQGTVEITGFCDAYTVGIIPESNVAFGLPMGWRNFDEFTEIFWDYGLLELMREAYAEHNMFYLAPLTCGNYTLFATFPIQRIADIKGQPCRMVGLPANFYAALGAAPVTIPAAEMYTALQRGTATMTVTSLSKLESIKLEEVIKSVLTPYVLAPHTINIIVNLDAWNTLSASDQQLLIDCAKDASERHKNYLIENEDRIVKHAQDSYGLELIDMPDEDVELMKTVAMEVWDKVAAEGSRVAEAVNIVKDYLKAKGAL